MKNRENRSTDNSKDSHCFCCAIDGGSPLLLEETKDGRNKGPGMTDADPENEIYNGPAPVHRIGKSPDSDTR